MDLKEVRANAKQIPGFTCRVCPACDGRVCRGEIPGVGGKDTGMTFMRNYEAWQGAQLNMNLTYEEGEVSTATTLLGVDLAAPIMAAPIGGLVACYGDRLTDYEYSYAIVKGCQDAGVIGWTGDGVKPEFFSEPLRAVEDVGGFGVPTIKPWPLEEMQGRLELAKRAGTPFIASDIDAAGLPFISAAGKKLGPKSLRELKAVTDQLEVPFVVKGVMTVESAKIARDAGAKGIVVSNHGGRVLDLMPATASVLPAIVEAVGDDMTIIVDGGIRTGAHILTALALGADGVLIGRPMAVAAYGGGADGVKVYIESLKASLKNAMLMTGCKSIKDITKEVLWKKPM